MRVALGTSRRSTRPRTGRGSTRAPAPPRCAATIPAPNGIPPWVIVGPSSITSTAAPTSERPCSSVTRRVRPDDRRLRVDRADVCEHPLDLGRVGAVDLVDDDDVGHPEVRLARVIRELVAGAQRVDDDDQQVGPEERQVVVAAVPDDHVGLLLGALEDLGVVDAGVDDHARLDGGLVLLALLDRRMGGVDVGERREPLDAHPLEVAVRHRVPDEDDVEARVAQDPADAAAGLALPAARADGADGDDRTRALEHRPLRGRAAGSPRRRRARPRPCASPRRARDPSTRARPRRRAARRIRAASSSSAWIGIPSGYSGPASDGG